MKPSRQADQRELTINKIVEHLRKETLQLLVADPNEVVNMVLMDAISQLNDMSEKQLNQELKSWKKKHSAESAFDLYN